MTIDLALLTVFLGSSAACAWLVWRKLSLLAALPETLIRESFVTKPSRLKVYSQPVIDFFVEERYKDIYYAFLVRALRRVRILLLKLERISFQLLQSLQAREKELSASEERYWRELRRWKYAMKKNGNGIPNAVLNSEPQPEIKKPTQENSLSP